MDFILDELGRKWDGEWAQELEDGLMSRNDFRIRVYAERDEKNEIALYKIGEI